VRWLIPLGTEPSWPVAAIEANRSLLLDIHAPGMHFTWSWGLYELDQEHTRLVLRIHTLLAKRWFIPLFHVADFGSFLMTRKHLLGVRDRAEVLTLERAKLRYDTGLAPVCGVRGEINEKGVTDT
jgi:hypothetical protein